MAIDANRPFLPLVGGDANAGIAGAGIGNVVTIAGDGVVLRDLVISGGVEGPANGAGSDSAR
ncbi:MAG TPA: hypothetical protein VGC47_03810 [Acidimicrobiia bacterium]